MIDVMIRRTASANSLDIDRTQMLHSLRRLLADATLSAEIKAEEVTATLNAVRQLASLAGVTHG